ncbi:hypothetical protein O6H91_05G132900 [Diphasiastrum complanatum]|uniref:Uncharacterized protein n=1 Tax=Diphasiastrum complanatum TaxID=34168 RepID=A0ACC2DTD1_DIPCM|nr:hypothetical protein O6H91_05G132900 [Diphasiastrum complanatum]
MGCASSHEYVQSGKKTKKRWIAPESHDLLHGKHLTSSFIHSAEALDQKLQFRSSISQSEARIAMTNAPYLPKLESLEKDHGYERTRSLKFANDLLTNQILETNATSTKIGTFSGPMKLNRELSNEPEVIDVCELMEGLEDAEDLSCSSFRIPRTDKHQTHNRSSSLSNVPSPRDVANTKPPVDSESRRKRHSLSQSHRQRTKFHSFVLGNPKAKNSPSGDTSQIQDTVTVIKEVIESQKPQRAGVVIKKLSDSLSFIRAESRKHSSQVTQIGISDLLPDQVGSLGRVDVSEKSQEHQFSNKSMITDHSMKSLDSTTSFAFESSSKNSLKDDEILSADAVDEFSFSTQSPLKEARDKSAHLAPGDDVVSKGDSLLEGFLEGPSFDGNSALFPSIPLQSMKYVNLSDFEKLIPPRGENRVVLYATSSSESRKTYEDCNLVRQILCSYNLDMDERDLSLHPEFKHELQIILQKTSTVSVPRLFIKGRHIGGVEEVCLLHTAKALERLLQIFSSEYIKALCVCCGGTRTLQCLGCNGMCLIKTEEGDVISCSECEKKGWIMCPICS